MRRAAGDADLRRQQHVCGRSSTPCAICTRLSIFVPAPIRVSPTAGRSIVEFAPISTSSSMTTPPICGIFWCVPSGVAARSRSRRCRSRRRSGGRRDVPMIDALANRDVRVDDAVVADRARPGRSRRADETTVRAPIRAPPPIDRNGPIDDAAPITASGSTTAAGMDAGVQGARPARTEPSACANAQIRMRRCAASRTAPASSPSARMTADARVASKRRARSAGWRRRSGRPARLDSSPATPAISSRRRLRGDSARRSAISRSVTAAYSARWRASGA